MPTREEMKRAAQTAFISQENSFQAAHESVDSFYQAILTRGAVYPSVGTESLTQQIAENAYEPTTEDWKKYERYLDQDQLPEQELGIDLEPER